jgi:histidinol-phosphate aminotransferase
MKYDLFPHAGIQQLQPYKPGKSIAELAREQGLSDIIKLASNENPLGCSPRVQELLAQISPTEIIAIYPSPVIHPLMDRLAKFLGIDTQALFLSNGSDYLYNILLMCFCLHQQKHLLTHQYAFSTYEIQAQSLGIPVVKVATHNWEVLVDDLIAACTAETGLICLANPNNPTGIMIPPGEMKRLLDNIPESTLVVIDEAYYEYSQLHCPYDSIAWLKQYPHLVLTRTFSKIYGLAGLRLGYAMANPEIIQLLRRVQLPFMVNQLAMSAGVTALEDQDFVQRTLTLTQYGLGQLREGLEASGYACLPSAGNFISFDCGQDGLPIYQQLLNQGIIVRPLHPYQMNQYLRVSVGTEAQIQRFLTALRGIRK